MLASVAALNPSCRFRSSLPALRRLPSSTRGNCRFRQLFLGPSGVRQISPSSSQYSSQVEYDNRISRYPPQIVNPIIPTFDQIAVEDETKNITPEQPGKLKITVVNNVKRAKEVLEIMRKQHAKNPRTVWACDTEVADIDLSLVGPVGNGVVTCVSIYTNDFDSDYGEGPGAALWIDNLGEAEGVLQIFKGWFEDSTVRKVWHNYGFDRHVLNNEGIDVSGFYADVFHMARLWDTAREKATSGGAGYSLEALSTDLTADSRMVKTKMKELFGKPRAKKDGTEGLVKDLPPIRDIQTDPTTREKWIGYSALDAVATYNVFRALLDRLDKPYDDKKDKKDKKNEKDMRWIVNGENRGQMSKFYDKYFRDFGELLTDMERNGIMLDNDHLRDAEIRAKEERALMVQTFINWAVLWCDDAPHINTASPSQIQHLLFGEQKDGTSVEKGTKKLFKITKGEEEFIEEAEKQLITNPYVKFNTAMLKEVLKEKGLKTSGTKGELLMRLQNHANNIIEAPDPSEHKYSKLKVKELKDLCLSRGLPGKGIKKILLDALFQDDALNSGGSVTGSAGGAVSEGMSESKEMKVSAGGDDGVVKGNGDGEEVAAPATSNSNSDTNSAASIYATMSVEFLREACLSKCLSPSGDRSELLETLLGDIQADESLIAPVSEMSFVRRYAEGLRADAPIYAMDPAVKKYKEISITCIGMNALDLTPKGAPKVSASVLRKFAGTNPFGEGADAAYGLAYDVFGRGEDGRAACQAIGALANIGQIDSTITNFLIPLQRLVDKENRIHCSLNLNTETGRLSSRKPNLQNQPALEKDQYKIRDAFIAKPGCTLIVADYGQLELRLLAHMTNCKSMLEAFTAGGCFHSRTAVGMYPHVKSAVDNGEVLLEWDYSKGQPTVPLVKDTYASERRKAKTLNFSIAYGKTVHGLAQDWGISSDEAEKTLEAWYDDRPEVKKWQEETKAGAKKHGYVRTILGRYRNLPDAMSTDRNDFKKVGHSMRAAINTPIQGSAADIVMMAMIKLWKSEKLKSLGWKLLLQIHDEVILEGPKESMPEAMIEVRSCMERPFDDVLKSLKVTLDVDAKSADSWYKAK